MTLLEGVGDEVAICVAGLLLLLLTYVAWIILSLPLPSTPARSHVEFARVQDLPSEIQEEETAEESEVESSDDSDEGPQEGRPPSSEKGTPVCNGSVPSDSEMSEETSVEPFQIRLKYLDDTERMVDARSTDTIAHFKRCHFARELSENRMVRLIYHGQVLRDESTLESYSLSRGCCIHVQVVSGQQGPTAHTNDAELDLSQFLWPLLGVVLGTLWMCHFLYREYFATSSTAALVGLSGLFLTVVWGQYTASRPERVER